MNQVLAGAGFVSEVAELTWMTNLGPRQPMFSLVTPPFDGTDPEAWQHLDGLVTLAIEAISLSFGGSGRMVGSADRAVPSRRRLAHAGDCCGWPGWAVSQLRRLLPDVVRLDEFSPEEALQAMIRRPQLAVWISLFIGAVGERRREMRLVRLWSVLESIANGVVAHGDKVLDLDGTTVTITDGQTASPSQLRGRAMTLIVEALDATGLPADPCSSPRP